MVNLKIKMVFLSTVFAFSTFSAMPLKAIEEGPISLMTDEGITGEENSSVKVKSIKNIVEDNKFADQYLNNPGEGYAMVTPIYPGMSLTIGSPALVDVEKRSFPEFKFSGIKLGTTVLGKVYDPRGNIVGQIGPIDCDEEQIVDFSKKITCNSDLIEGTYRVEFELTNNGTTLYDNYYFTAVSDFTTYKAEENVENSNNANIANVHPDRQTSTYPAVQLKDGELIYAPDYKGNRIMNYGGVGYKGGGEEIPNVPVRKIVRPLKNPQDDAYTMIQEAIDFVSGLPLREDGTRGTVYLSEGVYRISQPLYVRASGVVIRGAGAGDFEEHEEPFNGVNSNYIANEEPEVGITKLISTWKTKGFDKTEAGTLIVFRGNDGITSGAIVEVMDQYAATDVIHLSDLSPFNVGDSVIIKKKVNENWAKAMHMDKIDAGATNSNWIQSINQFNFTSERRIVAMDLINQTITLDTPLSDALDRRWGIATVQKFNDTGKITNVGIENIQGISHFYDTTLESLNRYGIDYQYYSDEKHPSVFVGMTNVKDGWFRNFTTYHFDTAYQSASGTRNVTVQDGNVLDPVSGMNAGERRYSIYFAGSEYMFGQRIFARYMRHAFIFNSYESGPNVFYDCKSQYATNYSEPHFRWSSGGLYDNVVTRIAIQNRWNMGTSHGWPGVNYLLYNCEGPFMISQPQLAANYLIGHSYNEADKLGSVADPTTGRVGFDKKDSNNMQKEGLNGGKVPNFKAYEYSVEKKVSEQDEVSLPESIYIQQLIELKGEKAAHITKTQTTVPDNIDDSENPLEGVLTLTSLSVNGEVLSDFSIDKLVYTYSIPYGTVNDPEVTATTEEGNKIHIIEPDDLSQEAVRIQVSNEKNMVEYSVKFDICSGLPLVDASGEQVDTTNTNYAVNILGNQEYLGAATKRWAGEGEQWIRMYIGKEKSPISGVQIGFVKQASNYRQYYFEIEYANDGKDWVKLDNKDWDTDENGYIRSKILTPESNPDCSMVLQDFIFEKPIEANFIRILAHGNMQGAKEDNLNKSNAWNNYWKMRPIYANGQVYTLPNTIEIINAPQSLSVGEKFSLIANVAPEETQVKDIEWKSSNKAVARVNAHGEITAVGLGSVTITATTFAGELSEIEAGKIERKSATINLTINK